MNEKNKPDGQLSAGSDLDDLVVISDLDDLLSLQGCSPKVAKNVLKWYDPK